MAYSKRKESFLFIQIGLFMDDNGIPIVIELLPSNTLDHLTLCPPLKKVLMDLTFPVLFLSQIVVSVLYESPLCYRCQ